MKIYDELKGPLKTETFESLKIYDELKGPYISMLHYKTGRFRGLNTSFWGQKGAFKSQKSEVSDQMSATTKDLRPKITNLKLGNGAQATNHMQGACIGGRP